MMRICNMLCLFVVLGLVACGGTGERETAVQVTPTAVPEPTATPTPIPTVVPTATTMIMENGRRFVLLPDLSTASYSVQEEFFPQAVDRLGVDLGETTTVGSTQAIEGELVLDLSRPFPLLENHFAVNIQSLRTDQPRRDERLREQGLNSNRFPQATFTATSMVGFPADYREGEEVMFELVGDLVIREQSMPTTWQVTATLVEEQITGTAVTTILMTDFGFDPPSIGGFFTVQNEVLLTIQFVAQEM